MIRRSAEEEARALLVELQRLREQLSPAEHQQEDALAVSRTVGSLDMAIRWLEGGHTQDPLVIQMVYEDVQELRGVVVPASEKGPVVSSDWSAAQRVSERLWVTISRPSRLGTTGPCARMDALSHVARAYQRSAQGEAAAARKFTAAAAVLASSAVVLAAVSVARDFDRLNYYFGISAALSLAALLLWSQSVKSRTAAREWTRLATGVSGIEPYLAPLSGPMQDLMRGVMIQRLFPRLIEDDDPLREPRWPDADSMLAAINYGLEPQPEPTPGQALIGDGADIDSTPPDYEPPPRTQPD